MTKHYENLIVLDPAVMMGKPVVKGTRITVEQVLRRLAQGASTEQLFRDYPHLTHEDVRACLKYNPRH